MTYPDLPRQAASADGFVPRGWVVEGEASGDLNRDGVADLAIVLRQNDPNNVIENLGLGENPFNTNPRILAVAFRNGPSGDYVLKVVNHTLIRRREDPVQVDPFGEGNGGIAIRRGSLEVSLHHFMSAGGWGMFRATYKVRYQNGRFELIGYDRSAVHRTTGETKDVSVNYLTRRMQHSTGHISSDTPTKVTWRTLPLRAPLALDAVGDGLNFDPER
ncbi:hypothetical protein GR328_14200 [Microvirga makkahensis]|uniref:Uncharacterized protein n=1 Tax=Microvirga makkahensis TaxID=1128670 RepID=A0A7X3SPY5_9HYPH|nr:hypothetical protein [Microvirga makkahensis]